MWELSYNESWVPKNWCFWTVVLEKNLESPLGFKEIEKAGLKHNIQKTKIMVSSPITSRQIDGETMETIGRFGALKSLQMVTAAMKLDICSLEEKLSKT